MTEEPRSTLHAERRRSRFPSGAALSLLLVLALAAGLLVLYARGGGRLPTWLGFIAQGLPSPLASSSPAEQTLRTLRLAGYRDAVVGETGGKVVVRVSAPSVRTPADVALTWQTAIAAASVAYPSARSYVAQVFEGDTPLLEVRVDGDEARDAIRQDDSAGLLSGAEVLFLARGGNPR